MPDNQIQKFSQRLTLAIDQLRYNPNSFSKELGYERSDTVRNAVKGSNYPSVKLLLDISARFPEINMDWLITGRGQGLHTGFIEPVKHEEGFTYSLNEEQAEYDLDELAQLKKDLREEVQNELKAQFAQIMQVIKIMHNDPGAEGVKALMQALDEKLG